MIDRLTEDQRKVLIIWFFLALFLIALLVLIASRKIKAKHDYPLDKNYIVVKDYSRYYTVTSVIDKFYNALNNKNYESAMKMLDDNYVKTNNLSTNNLNSSFNFGTTVSFKGKLMCSKRFAKGYTSYYVSGTTIASNVDKVFDDIYYEVVLNENNMTFNIKTIDASTFGGACNA